MDKSAEPLVSIVTPFYNTDEYLEECIKSVLAQTFENWEYILVDNCSTDGSWEIAKKYAQQDTRVKIIKETEFLNQVQNYNRALRYISPDCKYCKVVQADDWIFPNCIRDMVAVAEAHPTVAIVGAYGQLEDNVFLYGLPYRKTFFTGREVCRYYLLKNVYVFGSPNAILMRADLVRSRDPFYAEESVFEDAEVCFDLLKDHDFGYIHQVLTFSRRENESIWKGILPYNPGVLFELRVTKKFGSYFLTKEEYEVKIKQVETSYFRYLGESLLRRRGKEFWDFHREGVRTIGYQISTSSLVRNAILAAFNWILNPKSTIERIIQTKPK